MEQKLVVFISLLIDLLGFTLILPLLPKIFDYYALNKDDTSYNFLQITVNELRKLIGIENEGYNSVLFGGFIGSLFALLQFVSSTIIGAASDIYGRKPILLCVLVGILLSYVMWSVSYVFLVFLLSRTIGGLSKANVSLSIAIMTDLTDQSKRASAMALVGIAFSLGFMVGPAIGAFCSSILSSNASIFVYPAYIAIALTLLNIIFVTLFYKESLPLEKRAKSIKTNLDHALTFINPVSLFNFSPIKSVSNKDLSNLKKIGWSLFLYLFVYSGLEFNLTFLAHKRFNYNSAQQGKMFLFIGICMTLIQGGYVRRLKQDKHIKECIKAILFLIPAFVIIALTTNQLYFYVGLFLYCYSSAIVVQCLTTVISNYGSETEKGTITGIGRSLGALARSVGPIMFSMIYWTFGPEICYVFGSVALTIPLCTLIRCESKKIKNI